MTDEAPMPPDAGALWLCAIAQGGHALDNVTKKIACEEPLLKCAESLALLEGGAGPDAAFSTNLARALWALCVLKKREERDLGTSLLERLAELDPVLFSAESWALLREVSVTMSGAEGAGVFENSVWQQEITAAGVQEAKDLHVSGRTDELHAALDLVALPDDEVGDVDRNVDVGPYVLALRLGKHSVAIDFDAHQTPANRALRRQQWAALLPDVRVAEVTLASWDSSDVRGRAELLSRRIRNIEDSVPDDD